MTAISVSERLLEMAAFYTPLALTITKFVTFEKPGEKSPGFPRPTAAYDGAGSIHLIWLRLLFIYPKPLYDTPIVKESECNNRNDKRQYQKENQHNQRRQQGYLECHHHTGRTVFYKCS